MIFIDTCIFVDHLRGYNPAVNFFESLSDEDVLFSAITEAELVSGKSCNNPDVKDKVLQLLNKWKKIEVNNRIAVLAGDLSREYGVEIPDAIIAASAKLNKAELLTKNGKDFNKIKDLKVKLPY